MSGTQRKRKCRSCREYFTPRNSLQTACTPKCAIEVARLREAEKQKRWIRDEKRRLKTASDWAKEAQIVFNKYIRLRDAGKPCISCGRSTGCKVNAGHYRTVKAASHLRFNEDQVHLQCVHCNAYLSGNVRKYRIGLIQRIGLDRVHAIENDNRTHRWTIEELKAIKEKYRQKVRKLQDGKQ